ncbi:MAG: hypothetical protein AAF514_23255, partial [Verrucomicrobiota bacterium]
QNYLRQWWTSLLNCFAETDPVKALEAIETEAAATMHRDLRAEVVKTWARSDPEAVMEWVSSSVEDESERQSFYGNLSTTLAVDHPELALDALLASNRPQYGSALFKTFAEEDWEGTAKTMGDWDDADLRARAALSMMDFARSNQLFLGEDERRLLDWMAESPKNLELKSYHSGNMISEEERARVAEEHPDLYEHFLPQLIRDTVSHNPQKALEMIERSEAENDRSLQRLQQEALAAWAHQEPDKAATWVENMGEGEARDFAFLNLASKWGSFDAKAAGDWIEGLPESPSKDRAAKAFAQLLAIDQPAATDRIAGEIVDDSLRNQVLEVIWSKRLEHDVSNNLKALERANLPPGVLKALEPKLEEALAWRELELNGLK